MCREFLPSEEISIELQNTLFPSVKHLIGNSKTVLFAQAFHEKDVHVRILLNFDGLWCLSLLSWQAYGIALTCEILDRVMLDVQECVRVSVLGPSCCYPFIARHSKVRPFASMELIDEPGGMTTSPNHSTSLAYLRLKDPEPPRTDISLFASSQAGGEDLAATVHSLHVLAGRLFAAPSVTCSSL